MKSTIPKEVYVDAMMKLAYFLLDNKEWHGGYCGEEAFEALATLHGMDKETMRAKLMEGMVND